MTKLSADGSQLLYSTYLGGELSDDVRIGGDNPNAPFGGIAVDASGMIYVTGNAGGYNFPLKFPFQTHGSDELRSGFRGEV